MDQHPVSPATNPWVCRLHARDHGAAPVRGGRASGAIRRENLRVGNSITSLPRRTSPGLDGRPHRMGRAPGSRYLVRLRRHPRLSARHVHRFATGMAARAGRSRPGRSVDRTRSRPSTPSASSTSRSFMLPTRWLFSRPSRSRLHWSYYEANERGSRSDPAPHPVARILHGYARPERPCGSADPRRAFFAARVQRCSPIPSPDTRARSGAFSCRCPILCHLRPSRGRDMAPGQRPDRPSLAEGMAHARRGPPAASDRGAARVHAWILHRPCKGVMTQDGSVIDGIADESDPPAKIVTQLAAPRARLVRGSQFVAFSVLGGSPRSGNPRTA